MRSFISTFDWGDLTKRTENVVALAQQGIMVEPAYDRQEWAKSKKKVKKAKSKRKDRVSGRR